MKLRVAILLLALCSFVSQVALGAQTGGLKVLLTSDKAVYTPDEIIILTLRVINETSKAVTLRFGTTQRFDFLMQNQEGKEVWRWSTGRFFGQVLGQETLKPSGGEIVYRATVKENFRPGTFAVKATIPALMNTLAAAITVRIQQ